MTSASNKGNWMVILRDDIEATGSISKTAQRIGVSRSALSQILNGVGPYGTGKASTAKVEEKVMNTIGLVNCPFLSDYHGKEHKITGLECRDYAYGKAPTSSPRQMQHWRACQACEKRVSAPVETSAGQAVQVVRVTKKGKDPLPLQQAGVIDTVTLPLPEVGGPQVLITEEA